MPAPYWFSRIAREGRAQGYRPGPGQGHPTAVQSLEWFRDRSARVRQVDVKRITTETPSRMVRSLDETYTGQMLLFSYQAKHRDTLPYWDAFPLIFPIEWKGNSILSINLHYLPLLLRARLMDALYTTAQTEANQIKRLRISYGILNGSARFAAFRPCIKQHLFSHVRSRFFRVKPAEWDMALMLPTARFQKATQERVWADSERMIG